jgi:hypothetical protein
MNVTLVTEELYKKKLLERFSMASLTNGTQKLYTSLPCRNGVLLEKTISASSV